ncbi:MAG: hypothetical protein WAW96_16605 [Alphaproteobacteria bacterium]
MPRNPVTFDVARSIGAKLPDVAATAGKRMALKIKGRILACQAIHKSAEPNSLMVCIGSKRRDALLAEDPDACYLTKHYESSPVILVRLSRISRTFLRALLAEAWEFVRSDVK